MGNEQVGELRAVLQSERIEREREFRDLTDEIARLRSTRHPWCSNVPRDTAIRAAEDAAASERPALPDHRELPERVARLSSLIHEKERDFTELVQLVIRINGRVESLEREVAAMRERAVVRIDTDDTINEEQDHARMAAVADDPRRIPRPVAPRDAAGAADGSSAADRAAVSGLRTERVTRLEAVVFGRSADARTDETSQANHPAAADGVSPRSAPLPDRVTRGEGIGGAQSGLRTERLTLEITHVGAWPHPSKWAWHAILDDSISAADGESVRVIPSDEADASWKAACESARIASGTIADLTAERDAALARVAEPERNGSAAARETGQQADAEPVACQNCGGAGMVWCDHMQRHIDCYCARDVACDDAGQSRVIDVGCESSAPPPPRGWLTADERHYIKLAADCAKAAWDYNLGQQLENLLSRNSPPRVQMPKVWGNKERVIYVEEMRAALAEAGVEVDG